MRTFTGSTILSLLCGAVLASSAFAQGDEKPKRKAESEVSFPPVLPNGAAVVTDTAREFLTPPASFPKDVAIAQTPPTIDFLYYPGQDYPGKPWSVWGEGSAEDGKYFSAIGDHLAPQGNAFVYEYDAATKQMRRLMDVKSLLKLPEGHYVPGKIHSRVDLGSDGWLYFSTHRGSTRATTDEFHYKGDWILRHHPGTGQSEIVAHAPVEKHCIPTSVLDPKRLIFYGATAPGTGPDDNNIRFFAWDVRNKRPIYSGPDGPARCIALANSTGRAYFVPGKGSGLLMRFDPEKGSAPEKLNATPGMRAASSETPQGKIYAVSSGQGDQVAQLYAIDTRTEQVESLGPAAVGTQQYIASIEADPSGRFLYYVPGAHGGSEKDGSAVVQFDTQTRRRKVIAFLHPFYQDRYGCTLKGTYSVAISPAGDRLYITWNASRNTKAWDSCALTVLHIPESER